MAKTSLIVKGARKQKFGVRQKNRCSLCGRPRGFMSFFSLCRLCFRKLAIEGKLPGVRKSSW